MKTILMNFIIGLVVIILTACGVQDMGQAGALPDAVLTPYGTATITPTITPTREDLPTATLVPTLTPTPSEYTVKAKDTLIVIAYRNGLTVDELLAANPDVNPYVLSIGTILKIPAPKAIAGTALAATPTPAPVTIGNPSCTPALTGGIHCFAMMSNESDWHLENVVVVFGLIGPDDILEVSKSALLPLSVLQSKESLPVYAYFNPPIPEGSKVKVTLLSAYPVSSAGSTAFRLDVNEPKVEKAADGYSARVTGKAISPAGSPIGKGIRVVAIAYDAGGKVIGIRQYQEFAEFASGAEFNFNLIVYSTGKIIGNVQVFAEAFE